MADRLRLSIARVDDSPDEFEVEIFVNDVEMTKAGAGMGMDPYAVLIPENRFRATPEPRTIGVARCECGVYGCGMTDATIVRVDDEVHWEWREEVPMNRAAVFAADQYDREVERAGSDHSWETSGREAGRLILTRTDVAAALAEHDLSFDWVQTAWDDPKRFAVTLRYRSSHQVFLSFDWSRHTPATLAAAIAETLLLAPQRWRAQWHSIVPKGGPPHIAGHDWTQHPPF